MLEKLKFIETRYEELSHVIADPEVIARQEEWQGLVKEHASLEEIVTRYRELKSTQQEKEDTQGMLEETR
ncbi:MAG TPA: peptide chain release factor 1, partial [Clostridiales bacterium]|nr:peptide chain release factor 1 [Clostridiales bacterium]